MGQELEDDLSSGFLALTLAEVGLFVLWILIVQPIGVLHAPGSRNGVLQGPGGIGVPHHGPHGRGLVRGPIRLCGVALALPDLVEPPRGGVVPPVAGLYGLADRPRSKQAGHIRRLIVVQAHHRGLDCDPQGPCLSGIIERLAGQNPDLLLGGRGHLLRRFGLLLGRQAVLGCLLSLCLGCGCLGLRRLGLRLSGSLLLFGRGQ